ncbi:Prolyl 4-hydroxylase subunit alpha-1 [Zostera marina]|uniref:Prolyl 4-hydroxylase subunit alpha-1 n=1 Tax=Zostera marina TaxID=29655 RepID=A0A0K9PGU0_ZOSMR|nr:Prolyl 4-hydroxylase subunit alpha-1 [Zostera marina]
MKSSAILLGLLGLFSISIIIGDLIQLKLIHRLEKSYDITDNEIDRNTTILRLGFIRTEVISWSPRITIYHDFLSTEECDHLVTLGKPRLRASILTDPKTFKHVRSNHRTSWGMFLNATERNHSIIQAIETRISIFSQIPKENGESFQVLRYQKGEFYGKHIDYFPSKRYGNQRVATMLIYLNDVAEGGETYFLEAGDGECTCGGKILKGISVKPKKGNAVLFWNMRLDGEVDQKTIHTGCRVLDGVKWSATKWMTVDKLVK